MNIITTLSEQRKGKFVTEATEALAAVVKACRETGKKGSITITLKIRPTSTEMMVSDDIDPKIPKPDAAASVFYDTEDGQLSRTDPDQRDLPLKFPATPAQPTTTEAAAE